MVSPICQNRALWNELMLENAVSEKSAQSWNFTPLNHPVGEVSVP
jgi:hypothetical protein